MKWGKKKKLAQGAFPSPVWYTRSVLLTRAGPDKHDASQGFVEAFPWRHPLLSAFTTAWPTLPFCEPLLPVITFLFFPLCACGDVKDLLYFMIFGL